jgi:hypothetical protein
MHGSRWACIAVALGVVVIVVAVLGKFGRRSEIALVTYSAPQTAASLGTLIAPQAAVSLDMLSAPREAVSTEEFETELGVKKIPEKEKNKAESKLPQVLAGPASRLCHKIASPVYSNALTLFCKEAPGYPEIWVEGMLLLGEKALLDFLQHWKLTRAILGGRDVSVWHDRRDSKAAAMLSEQVHDTYNLKVRLHDAVDKWILDFGGNAGFTAISEAFLAPGAHVLTLEPSPWTYILLRANLAQAKLHSRVIALRGGMGGQPGTLQGVHYFTASAGTFLRQGAVSANTEGARGPEGAQAQVPPDCNANLLGIKC